MEILLFCSVSRGRKRKFMCVPSLVNELIMNFSLENNSAIFFVLKLIHLSGLFASLRFLLVSCRSERKIKCSAQSKSIKVYTTCNFKTYDRFGSCARVCPFWCLKIHEHSTPHDSDKTKSTTKAKQNRRQTQKSDLMLSDKNWINENVCTLFFLMN